jgi:hypothetical protein
MVFPEQTRAIENMRTWSAEPFSYKFHLCWYFPTLMHGYVWIAFCNGLCANISCACVIILLRRSCDRRNSYELDRNKLEVDMECSHVFFTFSGIKMGTRFPLSSQVSYSKSYEEFVWHLKCRVLGALSLGIKRPGREDDHSPPSSAEVRECAELHLHSPNRFSWRGA